MATCWGRRRKTRGTSAVRARLSRRSRSSRLFNALRVAWRIVSRHGAVASDQQAAESEHRREQAVNKTWRNTEAGQGGVKGCRRRQGRERWAACGCTAKGGMVEGRDRQT